MTDAPVMMLFELKRKGLTLGATHPRKMFVSAYTEDNARQLASKYVKPFKEAMDADAVSCTMVAHQCKYTQEKVITSWRTESGLHTIKPEDSS